ncbi:alpha-galactosidase-like protein [Motilibacter peucedani]|uniref:Alpha-galactosidase-like protein n=1 Tax=Motilibacter peucedani TaxID=598650 RepID=A0A420XQL6_9ACTN|nr:discoidin domain-containing protein [Motilibacter peucedani]RKS75601.1 alpha-galactosidase-like protein [Motilibacter peucedani]
MRASSRPSSLRRRLTGGLAGAGALLAGLAGVPHAAAASTPSTAPVDVYPAVGPTTSILDHRALLGDVVEPQWYESNIPFVDLPDKDVQSTYYYRWRTYKEALKYTGPKDGWILSEFLGPVGYSAPFGGINAAAAHHVYEGRWLRDSRYVDDYLRYWLQGTGSEDKEPNDGKGTTSTDWAHQYSFWSVDAAVARAKVTGDWDFVEGMLPELTKQYEQWKGNFDPALGLYWQTPVWDAMEYTASSYQSDDPYHGGEGYRPTINAYQYGDALALGTLYQRTGDSAKASHYRAEAASLEKAMEAWLWDDDAKFYEHVARDDNPTRAKLADREEIGFVPWYFDMPPAKNSVAWAQLTDPQGFAAPFGPTTVERRSPWFMHDALSGCCRWDGPSWPYATSQTLTALANLLDDYPAQSYVSRDDYYDLLRGYALTQRKNGVPYVAEAHSPDEDRWIYDSAGHSEDYNHSTYTDLVLNGLLGVRPQTDATLELEPLVPTGWDWFALENLAYHGHNVSVVWDRDGSHYGKGAGLTVWVDGVQTAHQAQLTALTVRVRRDAPAPLPTLVDDFANVSETGYPRATASYTWSGDKPENAIDGQDFHLDVPSTRWTTWSSPNREDWLEVDLGAPTRIADLRVSFYDDGGGVRTPDSFALQYADAAGTWHDVPGQTRTPAVPQRGVLNRVVVDPPVTASRVRILPMRNDGGAVGITALQSWRPVLDTAHVAFRGLVDGAVPVRPDQPVTVAADVTSTEKFRRASVSLLLPTGWTAQPLTATQIDRLDPGATFTARWSVTPPTDVDLSADAPVRVVVTPDKSPGRTASAVAPTRYTFDPADFPHTLWSDTFDTDRLADYRVDSPFGERAPDFSVHDGALHASGSGRTGALLAAPVTGSAAGTAVVVEPESFAGTQPEDSLFAGLSAGSGDNALLWYNNNFRTSGVDVRVGGSSRGDDVTGGCCASVTWAPGDRFAAVVLGGTLTTWVEHAGTWSRLRTAPVSRGVDPTVLASWSPAVGLRSDGGTLALDRVDVLGR